MAVVDVEFRANANFSGLISQANMANAAISRLQGSVTSLNAEQISQAFSEFSKGLTGSGQYIAQTVRVSDATQRFGQDLVNNKLQLKDYAREFGRYVSGRESQIKKLADQQVRIQQSLVVSRGMDPSGRLIAQVFTPTGLTNDLETNAMRATARLQVMNEFLHKASTSVINWGKNTQWAGRQMTVGLTVPLSMLATATGKAFYELDTQLIQMQKVYGTGIKGVGDEAIASIRSQVMDLSRELAKAYGIPVAQTAALAADIAQAGKTGQDLLSSVEQTTKLATLGEIDRQDAMKATLSIQSTFNQSTKELSDSINFLNAVENATNVSLQDLVTGIPKAGPVVKALGGDIKDLSLMMVAMKEGGIPASEAANAIKSSLASLINPTQKVTDKMKTFGIDLVGIVDKNAGQLMPTLVEFRNEINKLDELSRQRILEELFGKFQFARVNALFNNLGRAGSQTIQVMELMGLSTAELAGIADKELKTMAESASGRFKRLFATVQGDLAVAGEGILNAGSTILSVISKIINAFEKFPDGLKKFLGGTALLAAVIGPIIMTIGVLGNFFGYIMKGLALMRTFGRRGASDFQLMTAETIATANAGDMLENKLFDQAKAADLLRTSIEKLTASLVEVGAVSSTAGRAVEGVMVGAQGRAAAAGTAVEAMHTIPRSTTSATIVSPFSKIAGDKALNQGQEGQERVSVVDISSPEFRAQAVSGAAFNQAFTEMKTELKISSDNMLKIAKLFSDPTKSYSQIVSEFGRITGEKDPGKVLAKWVSRATDLMVEFGDKAKIYADMSENNLEQLEAAIDARITQLESDVKSTKYYQSGTRAQKSGASQRVSKYLQEIKNDPNLPPAAKMMLLDTTDVGLITPKSQSTSTTKGGAPGFSLTGGGGDQISLGSVLASRVGFGGLGMEASPAQQQEFLGALGLDQAEKQMRLGIRKIVKMKQGQARAAGVSVEKLNLAIQEILNDANLTLEQRAAQIAAYDIRNVPGAGVPGMGAGVVPPVDLKAEKRARTAAKVGGASSAISMGTMMGSTMLPSGSAQNIAMTAGTIAMFAPQLLQFKNFIADTEKVKRFGGAVSGLTSKFKLLGGASNALKGLGAALMGPVGLILAAVVALGVGIYNVFKNLEKGFKESQSWTDSSKESAEALGYKYQEINFNLEKLTGGTDKAKKSVEELTKALEDAPDTNPLKKMAEDFKNDADSSDTVSKAVAFFQLQIARGISESKAREQLTAVLTRAGKEILIPEITVKIGKINVNDVGANLGDALAAGLGGAEKDGWWQNIQYMLPQFNKDRRLSFDSGTVENMATAFTQITQAQAQLDPTKWQAFVSSLSNNEGLQNVISTTTAFDQLTDAFMKATGNTENPAWDGVADSMRDIEDPAARVAALADLVAINILKIPPAASVAGRAAQVAMVQTANAATAAAEAAAGTWAASAVKKPSTGGGSGGGKTADPYKAQKDANQKRIDQEKDIIKAIEKKRDAERKAFEEKKKQDDYLKKQADLQIGYREALATGDFAAAALVKNEMLAEQARKRAEDAQKAKDDKYQKDIDTRQLKVEDLEGVGKKLDALSQKAKETSVATSQAATDTYNTNVTTATTTMETLINKQKEHNYGTIDEFKKDNPKLVKQLTDIEVDVDEFFTRAFRIGNENIQANIDDLEGVNTSVKNQLTKLLLGVSGIVKLSGWIQDKTAAGKPPTNEQILARAKLLKEEQEGLVSITPWGAHGGGPIGDGMKSTRTPKKISSPMRTDEMMILAQKGEYMISAAAAGIIGRNNLDAINNGKLPVAAVGGNSGSNYNFTVNAAPGQDAKQIAQEVHRIFQINERRKGGART